MPLHFVRNDITKMETDAIVLPANNILKQGSGTSRAIYRAAGETQIEGEINLMDQKRYRTGEAVITYGPQIPAKRIIHAVCPQWFGGGYDEAEYLRKTYTNALILAEEESCKSIAFPLLSTGNYRYPRKEAIKIAVDAIMDHLTDHEMDVYLVFFTRNAMRDGEQFFGKMEEFIDDAYVDSVDNSYRSERRRRRSDQDDWYDQISDHQALQDEPVPTKPLSVIMEERPETFHDMLFRLIDESGMTNPGVYRAARIKKQSFSKIKNKPESIPEKKTILALAFALRLNTVNTTTLLMKAGYALSDSDPFDRLMKYCLDRRICDFKDINRLLEFWGMKDQQFPVREEDLED